MKAQANRKKRPERRTSAAAAAVVATGNPGAAGRRVQKHGPREINVRTGTLVGRVDGAVVRVRELLSADSRKWRKIWASCRMMSKSALPNRGASPVKSPFPKGIQIGPSRKMNWRNCRRKLDGRWDDTWPSVCCLVCEPAAREWLRRHLPAGRGCPVRSSGRGVRNGVRGMIAIQRVIAAGAIVVNDPPPAGNGVSGADEIIAAVRHLPRAKGTGRAA